MNLTTLQQLVGPINRGQLSDGFKANYEIATEDVPEFLSDDRTKARPPLEDMSHLNGKSTRKFSELAKVAWKRLTPDQRRRRMAHLRQAGMVGGLATKDIRHQHGA